MVAYKHQWKDKESHVETLPKAQRTRGLSSYHKITVHSSQILNILQYQLFDGFPKINLNLIELITKGVSGSELGSDSVSESVY